jgi:hypothetical protein
LKIFRCHDSESVVILSNLIHFTAMFRSRQTNTLPASRSECKTISADREPVIFHAQRTSSLEIKTQQESIEDVSGSRLPGGQRRVPLSAAPTTHSLTTSHTQTTDRTSRKEAIEGPQVSDSESVVILSNLIPSLIFCYRQTNTLPRVPSVRPAVQTIEPGISYEQRVSSREIKTQQGSVEDESGPRPPVLGSRTAQIVVRSDDTKGSGQHSTPLTATPTKRSLTTNVGLQEIGAVETHQRASSQINLSVAATGTSESSAASSASSDRRVFEVREEPRIKPISSIHSELSTADDRPETGRATQVNASPGACAPASSESILSPTYSTSIVRSDVRTSVSIAQATEPDHSSTVLSTGIQSSGKHMDASSSSIETREKRAASQRVQFSVDTKEIHDAKERMANETLL